jgi:hypothetical protein
MFWEAAHDDFAHGCTDPPEVLRLHARDAMAKANLEQNKVFFRFWFSFVLNIFLLQFLMSDVFLRSALHLLELEEFDEAAFFAEKSAEIEKGIDSHFDAHLAFCVATECYAKAKFLLLARLLH